MRCLAVNSTRPEKSIIQDVDSVSGLGALVHKVNLCKFATSYSCKPARSYQAAMITLMLVVACILCAALLVQQDSSNMAAAQDNSNRAAACLSRHPRHSLMGLQSSSSCSHTGVVRGDCQEH